MKNAKDTTPENAIDWPSYWLVVLERAVADGQHDRAADAQRQLHRLGYVVTIRPVRKTEAAPCR